MSDVDRLTTTAELADAHERRRWRMCQLIVGIVAVACYLNVLPNDYCYDDNQIVRTSAKVNDPGQWTRIWTTDHWSETAASNAHRDLLYRPIPLCSYRLVRTLAGPGALPQHIVNLLLHALICVWIVGCARLFEIHLAGALIAGLVFAVLPIHTEVVSAIVGRSDLLATAGVMLGVFAHHCALRSTGWGGIGWIIAAGTCAFLALCSKESAIAVVPLIVLFDTYVRRRAATQERDASWRNMKSAICLFYLLVPLALYAVLRYHALNGRFLQDSPPTKTINILVDAPVWQRVLGVVQLLGMYFAKSAWPAVLSIKYSANGLRLATSMFNSHVLIGFTVLLGLITLSTLAWFRKNSLPMLLVVLFLVSYFPTSNALVLIQVYFAERTWYLPSIWLALFVGVMLAPTLQTRFMKTVFIGIMIAMVARCWVRTGEWRNNGTLYAAAYRDQPHAVGPMHLYGEWLVQQGELKRGVALLNRALQIDQGLTEVHRLLGQVYLRLGNLDVARWHLQMADMQMPGYEPTELMLAEVSDALTLQDKKLQGFEARAADNRSDPEAQLALIRKLRSLGRTSDALARLRELDSSFADNPTWQAEYAVTLTLLGDLNGAIDRYRRSLHLDPRNAQVAVEFAMLLLERRSPGDLDEAWNWVTRAERHAKDNPSILVCKAELLVARGDVIQAQKLYHQALDLLPTDSPRRPFLRERLRSLGAQ